MFFIYLCRIYSWLMYQLLTTYHSVFRWLVLLTLLFSICRAFNGYKKQQQFTKRDNAIRHWTATIAHIQLTLGILLYFQSPIVKFFWQNFSTAVKHMDSLFFSLIHMLLMLAAVVIITIGSALAKRIQTDSEKFRTMFTWFLVGLIVIVIAIPWPFSPLAARPYFR